MACANSHLGKNIFFWCPTLVLSLLSGCCVSDINYLSVGGYLFASLIKISGDNRGSVAKDVFTWNIKSSENITNVGQNGLGNICASALLNKDKYVSLSDSLLYKFPYR